MLRQPAAVQGHRGGGGPPYTPAADARDLRSVLFNWGWHMGMLRSSEERDLIASLEYQGNGTMQVDGQPCTLTNSRQHQLPDVGSADSDFMHAAQRAIASNIEVLSGAYAWNEDIPGAELIAGKGKATPTAAATQERMIRLWASPRERSSPHWRGSRIPRFSRSGRAPRCPPMSQRQARRRSCGKPESRL